MNQVIYIVPLKYHPSWYDLQLDGQNLCSVHEQSLDGIEMVLVALGCRVVYVNG